MITLSQLIHMAATDPGFRAELAADPETALKTRGLQAGPEVVQALGKLGHLLAQPSESLSAFLSQTIVNNDWGRSAGPLPAITGHAAAHTK